MSDHPQPGSRQESEESIASYQKLLEHDPSSQVFVQVAEHLCAKSLWQEAEATCRRGLVFHPYHLKGKVLLGWALRELGEVDEAEHLLCEAHKELSKSAILYEILAGIATAKGNNLLAQHYGAIHQLLQTDPEPATTAAEAQSPEVHVEAEPHKHELIGFMEHLSAKYEQKIRQSSDPTTILTEADRQQLHEMFDFSRG